MAPSMACLHACVSIKISHLLPVFSKRWNNSLVFWNWVLQFKPVWKGEKWDRKCELLSQVLCVCVVKSNAMASDHSRVSRVESGWCSAESELCDFPSWCSVRIEIRLGGPPALPCNCVVAIKRLILKNKQSYFWYYSYCKKVQFGFVLF